MMLNKRTSSGMTINSEPEEDSSSSDESVHYHHQFSTATSKKKLRLDSSAASTKRGPWTAEEDELLTNLVNRFGVKKWAYIADRIPGRVGKQCRERWLNHLRTDVKKTAWTEEEDQVLVKAQQDLGNRWCAIAKLLPGRAENSVKNRWNSLINKKKRCVTESDDHTASDTTISRESSTDAIGNVEGSPSTVPLRNGLLETFNAIQANTSSTDQQISLCGPTIMPSTYKFPSLRIIPQSVPTYQHITSVGSGGWAPPRYSRPMPTNSKDERGAAAGLLFLANLATFCT